VVIGLDLAVTAPSSVKTIVCAASHELVTSLRPNQPETTATRLDDKF